MKNTNKTASDPDAMEINADNLDILLHDFFDQYLFEKNIEAAALTPSQFVHFLNLCQIKFFSNFGVIYTFSKNEIDRETLYRVYLIFKNFCLENSKEISLSGFLDFTGVKSQTIYNWHDAGLRCGPFDIYEKIREDGENSLQLILQETRRNPMQVLPILNHKYSWALQGVTRENVIKIQGAADLPALNCSQGADTLPPDANSTPKS